MMKALRILAAGLFLLAAGCDETEIKEEDITNFNKLEWMEGIWEGVQGDAIIYESWRKKNFRIMEGISYTTVDKRRVYSQDMRIEQSNNKISYILKNESGETRLELADVNDNTVEFINQDEGYPQRIIYSLVKKDRMNVALLGGDDSNRTELSYRKTEISLNMQR